jgi:hypothetical protein
VIREAHEEAGVLPILLTWPSAMSFIAATPKASRASDSSSPPPAGKASQSTVNRTNAPDCTGPTLPGQLVTERGAMRQ